MSAPNLVLLYLCDCALNSNTKVGAGTKTYCKHYAPMLISTPAAPGDYEDRSYQVVFNVTTQTGTLVVHTVTDNFIENDEDFTAVLSVPAGLPRVFGGTPSEATVTILDRTTAEVYFDPATYNVTEGQPADLILRLTRDVDPSVTIIMVVQIMQGSRGVYTFSTK